MIEYIGKNKAKITVSFGSGSSRRRKSKTVTYTSKKELKFMEASFSAEVKRDPLIDTTVKELVEMYIKSRRSLGIAETTIHGYENAAKRIYSRFKGVRARDVTPYMVQNIIIDMGAKYSPKTIRNTISLLSSAYDNAIKLGQLGKNPCKPATLPKKEGIEMDIFTPEEVRSFLQALASERIDYVVGYELALFCGMRRSEILALKEDDINITFKTVSITKSRHKIKGKDIVKSTKTEKSNRTIAVPDFVIEDINRLLEEHRSFRYQHTDYLIQDGFGKPLNPSTLTQQIYRIEKRAGLPSVSLHDLRHTFASMLNSAHVDIAMISRELGHSNINTTLGIYTHVFGNVAESSRGIANTLNSAFEKTRESASFLPLSGNEKTAEA